MPRQSSVALFLCASAGAALLLSGCSSATQELEKAFDSRVNIEPVVGSIWRISAERPKVESSARIADFVYERAKAFCTDKGMGMMPLTGSSSAASARPVSLPRLGSNSAAPAPKGSSGNIRALRCILTNCSATDDQKEEKLIRSSAFALMSTKATNEREQTVPNADEQSAVCTCALGERLSRC